MLFDVVVPEVSALGVLVYKAHDNSLKPGQRVIVRVGKTLHVGFVLGLSEQKLSFDVEIKPIEGIIDTKCVLDQDLWDMAIWAGRVAMCGVSAALRAILPRQIIEGEKIKAPPDIIIEAHRNFHEIHCFNPFDEERVNFYVNELEKPERTLILFPERTTANRFYEDLPDDLRTEAFLWTTKNLWHDWKLIHSKQIRIVIGSSGAIFSPLKPHRIIIEDEANVGYILKRTPKLSARSLAGRRAISLGAELITAGRVPSLKTYLRTNPKPSESPDRKNIILVDIYHSRREQEHGIYDSIPLTPSLIRHTYRELAQKHNVLWILDRLGESAEVFCVHCGQSVKCGKCGHVMSSIHDGNMLRCKFCGSVRELPEKCEQCGYEFFMGKRPGLEALVKIVSKYYPDVKLYVKGSKKSSMRGLILSTQRGLELCDRLNPSLIAWLDLDLELWRPEHDCRYNVYSMLYESYYRGRKGERKVLIQTRNDGMKTARFLSEGWGKFIPDELKAREELMLPPYGYIVDVEVGSKMNRKDVINLLEDAGIFVMDSGDEDMPLSMNVTSLETVRKILEPLNSSLKITVRSE